MEEIIITKDIIANILILLGVFFLGVGFGQDVWKK